MYAAKYDMTREENIEYAKRNIVDYIWKSARLEGLNVTFPETYAIYESARLQAVDVDTVETIVNLKHAWRHMLASIGERTDLAYICGLHGEIARGQALSWGRLRTGEIGIGGTDYRPPVPNPSGVEDAIGGMLRERTAPTEKAMDVMLYMMRAQLFWDGNKRAAMLVANKLMIENGCGIIAVSPDDLLDFNNELSAYYTAGDADSIKRYIYENCIDGADFSKAAGAGPLPPERG